jgi:glutamate mutase epsilon subunit
MSNFTDDNLNEEKVTKLMELWKSNESLEFKMQVKYSELMLILKWLNLLLEIKIKSNTLKSSAERFTKTEEEINNLNNEIKSIYSEVVTTSMNLKKIMYSLETIRNTNVYTL